MLENIFAPLTGLLFIREMFLEVRIAVPVPFPGPINSTASVPNTYVNHRALLSLSPLTTFLIYESVKALLIYKDVSTGRNRAFPKKRSSDKEHQADYCEIHIFLLLNPLQHRKYQARFLYTY